MADGSEGRLIVPAGAGGFGKSGGKGGGINETPNTLRSRQIAKVIDLLGEGTIQGLADGLQSVVFDTVRVQNPDGTFNAQGIAIDWRLGNPNQSVLPGFPNIQQEIPVGVQVKKTTPQTRTVINNDVNRVRLTVRVNGLTETTNDGTIRGSRVDFTIYLQSNGGGYRKIDSNRISGKVTGPYQRALTIAMTSDPPWDIRIVRDTPDNTSVKIQNDLFWDSYAELIDAKIRYRNSAIVGITIDASQFSSIPQRLYDVYGLLIQVPVNYDPVNGVYTGVWNGSFKMAWSNNPAWVFYDLVTNPRYGIGTFIGPTQIDKWALYSIGVWCDERVPDGKNTNERRWVCNCIISDRQEAYDLLQSMASIFRGQHYWAGGLLTPVADKPGDAVGQYTNASVENGDFNYQGSDRRARHTQCAVAWSDPDNLGQRRISLVEDQDGIGRYGLNRTDVVAIGCTSEGQAHRIGKWTLYTEQYETETVTFKVGLEGAWCRPGDIIQISDITIAGERRGGRIIGGSTTQVTLDAQVQFHVLTPAFLSCIIGNGVVETKQVIIAALNTPTTVLTVTSPFSQAPVADAVWVLTTGDLNPTLWRVVNVEESDRLYAITAVAHDPGKWGFIERNIILAERDISNRPTFDIRNLSATESLVQLSATSVGAVITISWSSDAPFFDVDWRPSSGNWTRIRTIEQSIDLPVSTGQFEFQVTPIDMAGFRGKLAALSYIVVGLANVPVDVNRFRVQINGTIALFTWEPSPDLDVQVGGIFEIRYAPDTVNAQWISSNVVINTIPGSASTVELPNRPGSYLIKAKDSSGLYSKNAALVISYAPDTDARNFFRIEEHPLWQGVKQSVEIKHPQEWLVIGQTGGLWDDQTDLMDDWGDVDTLKVFQTPSLNFGPTNNVGSYDFFNRIDLGLVVTTILTVEMDAFPYFDNTPFVDDRAGNVDDWQNWDLEAEDATGEVQIWVRQTDVNPGTALATDWTEFQPFISGQYIGRAFEFRAVLIAPFDQQVGIETLAVTADLTAKQDHGSDVDWVDPSMTIPFAVKFYLPPAITIQMQDGVTGDHARITAKDRLGFTVEFRNSSNAVITAARTFDWEAQGY